MLLLTPQIVLQVILLALLFILSNIEFVAHVKANTYNLFVYQRIWSLHANEYNLYIFANHQNVTKCHHNSKHQNINLIIKRASFDIIENDIVHMKYKIISTSKKRSWSKSL